jgi:hypothetical protein
MPYPVEKTADENFLKNLAKVPPVARQVRNSTNSFCINFPGGFD